MDGDRLGVYMLERELGSGGMGKVFAATVGGRAPGLDVGARVAVKVVHPHLLALPGFFMRFMREATIGASIAHPNVLRTHLCDQLVVEGTPQAYLVMEYVEGQDLRDLRRELEHVPEELCRHIGREMAKGLAAIHAAGIVHRDIKPENVLITADHVVKIMDLGLARPEEDDLQLSRSGAFVGSVDYAAPEQFAQETLDGRCDLHALGLVLYELSTAQHPYRSDSFASVMKRVCSETPRRIGEIHPQLSPFFEEVVHTLLAKSPAERFASADELHTVLVEGEDSAWWRERRAALRQSTRRPLRRIRIPRETQVYGRDDEIERLRAAFDAAQSGEGCVVLVEGEAGIGKSRLVDEVMGRLQQQGADLNFLFGGYPPGGAATASGAFATAFREQLGDAGCAEYLSDLPLLVSAFDALLRGDTAPTGTEALTKDAVQTCFVNVAQALARERTTVVLIDDLHFAPDAGRALFSALAAAVPGHRLLLIGTTRPGVSEEWTAGITRLAQSRQVELARLGARDLVALLEDAFESHALAESLGLKIVLKSDGNPFFAFEIIRGLREGQFIVQRPDGSWATSGVIDEIEIPSSVLDLVNARVADLTQEERDLLDVAACCGYEFDPGLVAEVVGEALLPTLKRFAAIEKKHRLVRASGRMLVFDHHQVQEALYDALYEQMREAYHAALADAIERRAKAADREPTSLDGALCVELCHHFQKGAQPERALRYVAAAQAHATSRHVHAQAIELGENVLAEPGLVTGRDRIDLLLHTSACLERDGRKERQRAVLREAVELADADGDDVVRARAHRLLGHFLEYSYENEEALAELSLARELAQRANVPAIEAAASNCMALVYSHSARGDEARPLFEHVIALRRELGDRAGEAGATINLGVVHRNEGRLDEAVAHYERGVALCREVGHRRFEAAGVGNLGAVHHAEGRLIEARGCFERGLAISREIGNRMGEIVARGNLGRTWHALGDLGRAQEAFELSLDIARRIGATAHESSELVGLGSVIADRGDLAAAITHFDRAAALRRATNQTQGVAIALTEVGDMQRRAGDVDAARATLDDALAIAEEAGMTAQAVLVRATLACLPGGDAGHAAAAADAFDACPAGADIVQVRSLLHTATQNVAHLEAAKGIVDASLALVPAEYRDDMLRHLRWNRDVMAAWDGGASDGDASDGESATVVMWDDAPRASVAQGDVDDDDEGATRVG